MDEKLFTFFAVCTPFCISWENGGQLRYSFLLEKKNQMLCLFFQSNAPFFLTLCISLVVHYTSLGLIVLF